MKKRRTIFIFLVIILILGYAVFQIKEIMSNQKVNYNCPDCNVILISVDTLRADHVGVYGYEKNTTPNIDEFSKDAVVFRQTISQAPSTEPSHASILTSMIPSNHRAFFSLQQPISKKVPTMAEILKKNNFKTVSYNGGGQLSSVFGFDRGFDIYESFEFEENITEENRTQDNFIDQVKKSSDWVEKNKEEKFFLFLHTYQVHTPYNPEQQYLKLFEANYSGNLSQNISVTLLRSINNRSIAINQEDKEHIINAYDAEIRSVDNAFGNLITFLKENKLYDKTLIIFTSDHGEELGEHGIIGWHSHALYDEQLKVPLIIKFPNSAFKSKKIFQQVRSIDILPSVLEVINVSLLENFEGISLVPLLTEKVKGERIAISERDTNSTVHQTSLRTTKWKLYNSRLFNLEKDPSEKFDVSKDYPQIKEKLTLIKISLTKKKEISGKNKGVELENSKIEQLEYLGYMSY